MSAQKNPVTHYKKGEWVYVTLGEQTVRAVVVLASPNGRSLMLGFQALVGGYVGMMPVLWGDHGFEDLIGRRPVKIKPAEAN